MLKKSSKAEATAPAPRPKRTFDDLERGCTLALEALADQPDDDVCRQHAKRLCDVVEQLTALAAHAATAATALRPRAAAASAALAAAGTVAHVTSTVDVQLLMMVLQPLLLEIEHDAAVRLIEWPQVGERRDQAEPVVNLRRRNKAMSALVALRLVCHKWRRAVDNLLAAALHVCVTKDRATRTPIDALAGITRPAHAVWPRVRMLHIELNEMIGDYTMQNVRDLFRCEYTALVPKLRAVALDVRSGIKTGVVRARLPPICVPTPDGGTRPDLTLVLRTGDDPARALGLIDNSAEIGHLVLHCFFGINRDILSETTIRNLQNLRTVAARGPFCVLVNTAVVSRSVTRLVLDCSALTALLTNIKLPAITSKFSMVTFCAGSRNLCPRSCDTRRDQRPEFVLGPNADAITKLMLLTRVPESRCAVALDAESMRLLGVISRKYDHGALGQAHALLASSDHYQLLFARAAPATAAGALRRWFREWAAWHLQPGVELRVVESAQMEHLTDSEPLPRRLMADFWPAPDVTPDDHATMRAMRRLWSVEWLRLLHADEAVGRARVAKCAETHLCELDRNDGETCLSADERRALEQERESDICLACSALIARDARRAAAVCAAIDWLNANLSHSAAFEATLW